MSDHLDQDRFATLLHWIRERESIRRLKEAGRPRPWTSDPILREWRFCNVNRCDDTVTRWIFEHIIAPHRDSPVLWFNLVIARLVNWPASLAALGYFDKWDEDRFIRVLNGIRGKAWTGAYMIPAGPVGVDKPTYLAEETLFQLWDLYERGHAPADGSCYSWATFIEHAQSMGGFLTNQVVTDMKYTPVLAHAPDRETFVIAGPGTQRGLNRIYGLKLDHGWKRNEAAAKIAVLRGLVVAAEPSIRETMRDLNNLSNCLCELDKYLRVSLGEGKPRARYSPAEAGLFGAM